MLWNLYWLLTWSQALYVTWEGWGNGYDVNSQAGQEFGLWVKSWRFNGRALWN